MQVFEHLNGFTISVRSRVSRSQNIRLQDSRRGNISSFSSKSAARLRELLLKLERPLDKLTVAVTLTLPINICPEDWRKLIERYRMKLSRSHIGMIWRVELQRRKVPHLHCVAVCDTIEDIWRIWDAWIECSDTVYEGCLQTDQGFVCVPVSCHRGFLYFGVGVRLLRGEGWFRYVASHTTKHKHTQLGWAGRQWGVFNKQYLSFKRASETTVDERFLIFLGRCCRKRFRCRLDLFRPSVRYDFFCSPSFISKAKSWFYRDMPF